jgi:hypothetical protein
MAGGKRSVPEIEPGEVSIAVLAGSGNNWRICAEKGSGRRLCAGRIETLGGR